MFEDNFICRHNQTGFCKYGMQCMKVHVNEICKTNADCKDVKCTKRHPKKCKGFESSGKCKFLNCAYLRVNSESDKKTDELITVVNELKDEIRKVAQNVKRGNNVKMEKLEMDVKELKDDIKMMAKHLQKSELLLIQLNNNEKKVLLNQIDTCDLKCDLCDYRCKK